jgi:hypothetical protein
MEILEVIFQLFGNSPSIGVFIGTIAFISIICLLIYFLS